MREYVLDMGRNLKALKVSVSLYIRHLNRTVLWAGGVALGLLVPSAVFVFWYRPAVLLTLPTTGSQALHPLSDTPSVMDTSMLPAQTMSMTTNNNSQSTASLKINNKAIPIPSNGTVHQEIHNGTATTTVDVSTQSSSSESTGSSSSLMLNVNSHVESSDTTDPSRAP